MLKRCLLAVIVALLVTMTSSQIAAATNWNDVKHCNSKAELARWIEAGRCEGRKVFNFTIANFKVDNREELIKFGDELVNKIAVTTSGSGLSVDEYGIYGARFTYTIKNEYPGTRVANAYLSKNQQQAWMNLNHEEQYLFNIAVGIIDEANKLSSEREKANYIHKVICDSVKFKNENDRNKTAIGALIDGYAQCQGYSDTFYMLGRMAGLNVGRIGGTAGGNGHEWNWITFIDGKSYCIDVTLDDTRNSYDWFLKTRAQMEKTHSCYWEIIPNLQ